MADKKITYAEAIGEVEKIIEKFNNDNFDVDALAAEVKRATELIDICKQKLRKAEDDVAKVLKQE